MKQAEKVSEAADDRHVLRFADHAERSARESQTLSARRIGLVTRRLDPHLGGAERWTHLFAKWLLERGHDLHLISEATDSSLLELGGKVHAVPDSLSRLAFAAACEQQIDRLSLDIVHDMGHGWRCDLFQPHGGSRHAAFAQNLLLESRWLRPWKRLVAPWLPRYREFRKLLQRQYMQDGRLFLALSKRVQSHFEELHGVSKAQIRQIYNGVDVAHYQAGALSANRDLVRRRMGVRDREVLFLLIAHNLLLKGLPAALQALAALQGPYAASRLVVVGGRRIDPFQQQVRRLGLQNRVIFVGAVGDPRPFYSAADCYLHPTLYDPCSLVVLEALASAVPVITSRFNGASELMTHGCEGFVLHDPQNIGEIQRSMEAMFDSGQRKRMAAAARRLSERNTLEHNFRQIEAVYAEILQRRRAGHSSDAAAA